MKHGKGTELPGMPQSQGARIGVIYVSPDDDRRTVLTAILAEERLKREKIVLDLPQKNAAFQRSEDFDDLKTLHRNKLQAELIFVTPPGPGPANFARKHRFTVFSNMDSFVRFITAESTNQPQRTASSPTPPANQAGRKGLLGGTRKGGPIGTAGAAGFMAGEAAERIARRRQLRPTPASNVSDLPTQTFPPEPSQPAPLPPQTPALQTENEKQDTGLLPASIEAAETTDLPSSENKTSIHDAEAAEATGIGAGMLAADTIPMHETPSTGQGTDPDSNIDNDDDALPPASEQPTPANQPNTKAPTGPATPRRKPTNPLSTQPEQPIIDLFPPKGTTRTTKTLPPSAVADTSTQAPPPPVTPSTPSRRNTGKTIAAGAAGAAVGDALTGTRQSQGRTATPSARNAATSTGGPSQPADNATIQTGWPPPPSTPSPNRPLGTPPNRRRATLIVALIIVIALLLCGGGWAVLANNGILPLPGFAAPPPPPAAITITPASQVVQDTFVMQSAGTNADPAKREVPVRNLTSTQTDTKAVNATGHHHEDAASATGTITFSNSASIPQTVAAGTVFKVGDIQVTTDKEADIPAAASATQPGQTKVPAHAVQAGPAGNIAALAINLFPCCGSINIQAQNQNAFTGGKNTVDYPFLSQDDVNKVTNDNQGAVKGKAQNDIKAQMKAGEQFLGDLNCGNAASTADKPVGDQGVNVPSANVTVKVTCDAQVYDTNAVKTIAQNELQQGVNKNPALGPQYVLAGNIVTGPPQALQIQEDPKITSFSVQARGLWYYKWTDAMKNDLRNKVKGLKLNDAQTIVNGYQGVDKAKPPKIEINNGGNTFPSDPNQITINVNVLNGLSEGNTQAPTPIPTSSTPANSAPTPTNPFNMPK
jgi:hypothetical protein